MDEGGTFVVNIATTDEDGDAKAPETLNWTLTDETGATIINNRQEVAISNPTASEDVVLDGDDCAVLSGETGKIVRIFTVTGTYNSTLGNGLHLRGRCYIYLDDYEALPL
jgi:hypothetical protein